uniref:Uncharacterized protein n=1 Tax=Oryza barthii TaxID=65489 RepID=A0A0D3EYF5_9ORYZ
MNASPSHCNCSDGGGGGGDALLVSPEYGHEGGAGRNDVGMSPVKRKEEAIGRAAARFPAAGSIGAGGIAIAARRLVLLLSLYVFCCSFTNNIPVERAFTALPLMIGIGGMLASSVVNRVASKLSDLAVEDATLLWRFKDDVDDMKEKMIDLEAVMQDADNKVRQGGKDGTATRRWLAKLKSDVLDELDAAHLIKNHQSKLKLFFSQNNQFLWKMTVAHNMKNLREKIDKIEKESQKLNLVRHEPWVSRYNETFAAINSEGMDIGMIGRDAEKEKIISLLLDTEAKEHISIIPIVGLGGLGKTTLAQAVFADKRIDIFDVRVWVYVSKDFDLLKIGQSIVKRVNHNINLDKSDLQFVQDKLKEELANRRYLIILDDLWEEYGETLENLKKMLQHGSKGSKIIVTTRNISVVQVLCTGYIANERKICPVHESDYINLGVLSLNDCWRVMKRRIFGPDDDQSGLEEIGREIAERCGGLPLVANALGQVMSEHRNIEAWKDIREKKIILDFKAEHQQDTLERLMLSYYFMKLEFKRCFTYLAAFSKGFVMDSDRLIQQWSALGYIQSRHNGQRCINYLLGMSFLQISKSSLVSPVHTKAPRKLTMHDLVHDLATIIAADEFLVMDATDPSTWNKANSKRYCRHAQLMNYKKQYKVFKDLPSKARTIHSRKCTGMQLPPKSFSQSKYIRILDLSGSSFERGSTPSSIVLPSSVRKLMLLSYLDVSGLPIIALPKYLHTLQNMQTLILSNCSLEALPANIGNLHKLCYLDLSGNSDLTELPASSENLLNLSLLNLSGCTKLKELPESMHNFKCLQQLDMSGCCALQKLPDKFGSLPKLSFVNLSGCSMLTKLPDSLNLESLEHLNLSDCYKLEKLPEDFGCLDRLEVLDMSDCYRVQVLPKTFSQLKHLINLNLSDCHGLIQLPQCFGDLSKLQSLNLTSCSKLQSLPWSLCKMFNLKHLNLSYCIRLENLPSSFGDLHLQVMDLTGCYNLSDLPDSISNMTSLTLLNLAAGAEHVYDKAQTIKKCLNLPGIVEHDVHEIESGDFSSIVELGRLRCRELEVRHLENVERLEDARKANLRDMSELRLLILSWELDGTRNVGGDKLMLENLIPPRTLEIFTLQGYMCKDFPKWMSGISSYLPCLLCLGLSNLETCDSLPAFGQLPNLRLFSMVDMPNIRKIGKEFYGQEGNCKKLRVIWLERMANLEEWWTTGSGEEDEELLIPNLHYLNVVNCPKLSFQPYPPSSMDWTLDGSDKVLPERGFGSLASSTFPFCITIKNCNFSPNRWSILQHLATLEVFRVDGCSGLQTLPDIIQCFVSLRELCLMSLEELEILPEWLGLLVSLEDITIVNCTKLTSLPKSIQDLTALRVLGLKGCEGLEILPEGLGHLISMEKLVIIDCPKLTSLPKSLQNLTALRELRFVRCEGLKTSPELFGHFTSLKCISIRGCPNLTYLPESTKNLSALEELRLGGLKNLPEWIVQFICLKEINIFDSPDLSSLPEGIQNLTSLKKLNIRNCPRLIERCQGEDANKISHIATVILDDERFMPGQAIEGSSESQYNTSVVFSCNPSLGSSDHQALASGAHKYCNPRQPAQSLLQPAVSSSRPTSVGGADFPFPHPVGSAMTAKRGHRRRGGEGVGGGDRVEAAARRPAAGSTDRFEHHAPPVSSGAGRVGSAQAEVQRRHLCCLLVLTDAVHCESAIPSMSGIGGMIASSVANRVASRLSELVVEEATLLWRFKDDVDDMEEKMRDLEAVIQDVDGKARQGGKDGEAERRWLNKLKSVAYDVEDVLDELDAAQLIKNHQPKLKLFLSRNNPLLRKMTIARNMKNSREKIVAIKKDSIKLHHVHRELVAEGSRDNETFADDGDVDIGMLGRDAETKKIINLLLNTEAKEDISIIPIVGLGGLGKTTLAQAVFADKRVNVFDLRIWVYVSKEFDLLKIGKAIIRGANRSINLDNCNLQFVNNNLKKELANRRYLIVLDDLWEEYGENLEKLKQMLQHGGKGSKIIATTRSGSVVQVLYTGYLANERKVCPVPEPDHINLGVLSPYDCWSVMKRRVFGPDDGQNGLEEIGRQIAEKCGGLPLVANALGQVMSEHRTVEAWTDIRDRKIVLDFKADHQQDTIERLMLSYYYMKREFKMCFTYLAAFSKGFVMDTDRLIQQWIALGYIEARDNGQRCVNYLLRMSFLQISKSSMASPMHTKAPRKLTMHDLVHDLATIIAPDEFLVMDATMPNTWSKANNKRYCRHAQLVNYQKQPKFFKDLPSKAWSIKECLNLPGREEHDVHEIENGECCSIVELGKLSCRALGIQHLENVERLDNAREAKLRDMTDLRELTLSWGLGGTRNVDKDEEVLENLLPPRTLESFMLDGYMCKDFPNWVSGISSYLPCLIYLCLSNLATCDYLPAFGRLPNLRFFCMKNMPTIRKIGREFYDGEGNCKKLRIIWLERMDNLEEWWTTRSGEEDREFLIPNLHFLKAVNCPKLSFLPYPPRSMHWSLDNSDKVLPERGFGSLASSTLPFRVVINNCKYPPDMWVRFQHLATIEIFQVEGCSGLRTFPDILQSFVSLRELYLCSWENLEILPEWLGQLICLEVIEFINCPVLTALPTSLQNLTSLRELLLLGCKGLETLPEGMGRLISLEKFIIMDCPKLTFLPESMKNLTALIELLLDGCKGLETLPEGLGLLISLKKFVISNCPKLTYLPESMKKLTALIELRLDGCKRLETLPKWLGLLISLKKIVINNYPMLTFLPESMKNLTAMKVLYLYGCKELEILPEGLGMLISLEKFVLIDCPKLTFLPESMKNLTALIELLRLDGCKGLEILPEWLGMLVSLEEFIIIDCPKLTFLPSSMKNLTAITELRLDGCKGLEILPEGLGLHIPLKRFVINDCPMLTFLPELLGHLTALKCLDIQSSPNLTYLPESMKNLTALEELWLEGFNSLPEWIGQFIYLKEISIFDSPNLTSLPESIWNITTLELLYIYFCPRLAEWCQREDTNKISRIPKIMLDETGSSVRGVLWPCAPGSPSDRSRSRSRRPVTLASKLSLKRQFAVSLLSTGATSGVAFFGSGPYNLMPLSADAVSVSEDILLAGGESDTACLAFVDCGWAATMSAVTVRAFQMENVQRAAAAQMLSSPRVGHKGGAKPPAARR